MEHVSGALMLVAALWIGGRIIGNCTNKMHERAAQGAALRKPQINA
jgi:hypothetical protein